jgi:hypothetical protein
VQDSEPSLEYLLGCSKISLESFGLSRLNRASNLRKELSQVAEEWVAAEVSFRLARLIVDRRDAGQAAASLSPTQPAMLSSGNQLTLPLPAEVSGVAEETETVRPPSKKTRSRKDVAAPANCANARSKNRSTFAKSKVPAVKIQSRSESARCIPPSKDAPGTAKLPESARLRGPSTSLRAITELRALDKVASSSPEMHSGSLRPSAGDEGFVRECACSPVFATPKSCMEAAQSDRLPRKTIQFSRAAPVRKLLAKSLVRVQRAASAS